MTNILFCYWLQGYFEIAINPELTEHIMILMDEKISSIKEPLTPGIQWLRNVYLYVKRLGYKQETLDYFQPLIQQLLNSVFFHYFENHLARDYSLEELEQIHTGERV